jgi:hypothetical protein
MRKLFAALFIVACSSSSNETTTTPDTGTTASGALPCEVDAILAKNCRSCHGEQPKFGAPMPLTNDAQLHAPAVTDKSKSVFQMVKARINDATRPMPPGGLLPANELSTVNAWLDKGAPKGDAPTCNNTGPTTPKEGPDLLPCPASERAQFTAHAGGSTEKFAVPQDAGNLQQCFYFKSPFEAGSVATAFAPIIDDTRVVHHWILFETATPQAEGTTGLCKMPLDATFITGWAPGGTNRVMPPDVGMKLPGKEKWLILQLHYWNVAGYSDSKDASGVSLCVEKTPRKYTAAISTLGTLGIGIPAKAMNVEASGTCTPTLTEPVFILSSAPHMHQRGRVLKTEIWRGGDPTKVETVVSVDNFDFNAQKTYALEKPIQVNPGDKLKTTCIYDNPGSSAAYFGEKTEDEMCFNFVFAYPETGLFNAGGAAARRCIDPK